MSKKNKGGLVYSTDPDFKIKVEEEILETPEPAQQKLTIELETKHRAGKIVTVVWGFVGNNADLEKLGKQIKNYCGTGGSAKDGEIIVQGDHKEKVLQFLLKSGYTQTRQKK